MTRAPVVEAPRNQAVKMYRWLESKEGMDSLKKAFDSTSSYARLSKIEPEHPVNGKVHIRFTATTGDAMGENLQLSGLKT